MKKFIISSVLYIYIQNIRTNCYVIFHKFFPIIFSDGKFISFQLYLLTKVLTFVVLCGYFLFLLDLTWLLERVENICCHLLMTFIEAFLLFIQSGESIYIWSTTVQICFITFIMQQMTIIKDKLTTFNRFLNYFNVYF